MKNYNNDYQQSIENPETFWLQQAEKIEWFTPPSQGLTQNELGLYRWFEGGKLNTCHLALDYHVANGRAEQLAVIYDSPVTDTIRKITYRELRDEVALFAGVLKRLGVEKGDRVVVYMPMIPQTVVAMLACARIGAIHSVVFGGFAARELAIRIDDAQPKLILAASGGIEVSKKIHYKPIIDAAIKQATHQPNHVVVYQRPDMEAQMQEGRDLDWDELMASAEPTDCVPVDATDPLYILYTSGTTGKPKGIVRDNGGHAVAMKYSMEEVYGVASGDVYWAASDVGWVVGHSYIVYAPLIHGCTTILFEGKPIKTPDAGIFWRLIAEHGVKTLFTAPTAIRAIKKEDSEGELLKKYDISSLQYLFLAGERCDVATYNWAEDLLGIPVIDHWWQTESGWAMLANMAGYPLHETKPGSATKPVCGYDVRILRADDTEADANEEGSVVIKLPLPPSCLPTLWKDDERFIESYLMPFEGYYFSGDGGYKDEDGYVFITGRMDDVINVAGHRLSTADMEEVVASHPAVAECAVTGIADELRGQVPVGFVVLKQGVTISEDELQAELVQMVRQEVGAVACFKQVAIAERLPKTRSGKILRKIMRHIADGKEYQMPSTIENPDVLAEMVEVMKGRRIGVFG
ncbi:MAG: propionyl-CoA synthetase [Chitinophagales bacterium]